MNEKSSECRMLVGSPPILKSALSFPFIKLINIFRSVLTAYWHRRYENFEIILINDNSPDTSRYICDEYAAKDSCIIVLHNTENLGVSAARNTELSLATGDYIGFIDSDDKIEPNMYESLYNNWRITVRTYPVVDIMTGMLILLCHAAK